MVGISDKLAKMLMVDACVADVADVAYIAHTRLQSQFDASKRTRSAANWKGIQAGTGGRFRHPRTPHELEVILLGLVLVPWETSSDPSYCGDQYSECNS